VTNPPTIVLTVADPATQTRPDVSRRKNALYADAIRACCHPKFCLKQRLWSVEGLATDKPEIKSLIPCFEPCAVMLEFARTAARVAQEQSARPRREEAQRRAAELRSGAVAARQDIREADFSVAENPRRIQLELEKIDGWINDGLKQESL
jgi:hypothetical protein